MLAQEKMRNYKMRHLSIIQGNWTKWKNLQLYINTQLITNLNKIQLYKICKQMDDKKYHYFQENSDLPSSNNSHSN